jgi:exonuclease SbcD
VNLTAGRPLREFTGTLDQLAALAPGWGNALSKLIIHTEILTPDLSDQVARLLPAAVLCDVTEVCATSTLAPVEETAGEATAEPELPELFREFLTGSVTTGAEAGRVAAQFTDLLHALDEERPPQPRDERRIEELLALAHRADRIAAGDYGDSPRPAPSHAGTAVSGAAPPGAPSQAEGNGR